MSNKDMLGVKIEISGLDLMEAIAGAIKVKLSSELNINTIHLLPKLGSTAEHVLISIAETLKEMSEDPKACLKFAQLLGLFPADFDIEKKTKDDFREKAAEKLRELDDDKEVPDEIKEFLRNLIKLHKGLSDLKREREANNDE